MQKNAPKFMKIATISGGTRPVSTKTAQIVRADKYFPDAEAILRSINSLDNVQNTKEIQNG